VALLPSHPIPNYGIRTEIRRTDHAYFHQANRRIGEQADAPSFCPVWADPKLRVEGPQFASQELRSEPAIIAGIANAGKRQQ
jgi:hypothetical protein